MAAPGKPIDERRLALLKGVVRTLPANLLASLEMALGLTKDAALGRVRELVSAEIERRHVCEVVFQPFVPLFAAREDGLEGVHFPRRLLQALWDRLEVKEPELFRDAFAVVRALRPDDVTPVVFFRLVRAAGDLCRSDPEAIARGDDADDVAELARYLDLHRIIRQTLGRMSDFAGRIDAEKAASLRVMFKDASELETEGGRRYLELIFANLEEGGQIIKFVATLSDHPKDRFLAESELAVFGERLLTQIEARVVALQKEMGVRNRPCENMELAADQVSQALNQLQSFEQYVELSRDGPWGARIAAAHKEIAGLVEQVMNGAEKLLGQVLPMRTERIHGRMKRETPNLEMALDPARIASVRHTLVFIGKARQIAAAGGFASLHTRVTQTLEKMMDDWFGQLLDDANRGDLNDVELAGEAFDRVTGLMAALCGEDKARTARRRVAASELFRAKSPVSGDAA